MEEQTLELETSNIEEENKEQVEQENKQNEEIFNLAINKLESYGLEWTIRSIRYIINKENVSFGQLRSCVYIVNGQAVFDYIQSTILLIKAGLVGSKQFTEQQSKELEDRAYEIIEDWRNTFGCLTTLHLLIINIMETKHFFMNKQDLAVINHLSYKNLQKDISSNLLKEDLEEKLKQAQAYKQIF